MRRILIVDDAPDVAVILSKLLRRVGYETTYVGTGGDALKTVDVFEPHVIFIDRLLPDMSGLKLAKRLRETSNGHTAKLVSLTAMGIVDGESEAALFDAHLLKPAGLNELCRVIES